MIKLDVNRRSVLNGHVELPRWNRVSCQPAGTMSGQTAFDKLARPAALYCGGKTENSEFEDVEGTELNGIEQREDGMPDAEGDGIDGEEELAPPELGAGLRNKPTQKDRADQRLAAQIKKTTAVVF